MIHTRRKVEGSNLFPSFSQSSLKTLKGIKNFTRDMINSFRKPINNNVIATNLKISNKNMRAKRWYVHTKGGELIEFRAITRGIKRVKVIKNFIRFIKERFKVFGVRTTKVKSSNNLDLIGSYF